MSARHFTKLFASLTESTLWVEQPHHVRIVWITMLAMADWDGVVSASIPGLAARARVTVAEVEEALRVFLSPDKYSRTPDFEGRRIEEIPGGWVLLNHKKYRKVVSAEAEKERKREYMRERRGSVAPISPHVPVVAIGGDVASLSLSDSSGSGSDPDPEGARPVPEPTPPNTSRKGRFAPDDFAPSDTHRFRVQELRLDMGALLRSFKLQEFNRDYSDWNKRFSKWIEDERIKRETEAARAKAHSSRSAPPGRGFGGGVVPALEPTAKHVAFAKQFGVEVDPIVNGLVIEGAVEAVGLSRAREMIGERLSAAARKARGAES